MALLSPYDSKDFIWEEIACGEKAPVYFAPYAFLSLHNEIKDQKAGPTCMAMAITTLKEFKLMGEKKTKELSPEFIYHHRCQASMQGVRGMFARDAFKILKNLGVTTEKNYPYMEGNQTKPPSNSVAKHALKYRSSGYAKTSIESARAHISQGRPILIVLPMYNINRNFWIPCTDDVIRGYHAVLVVGYQPSGLILRNSWGPKWNINGHCLLPNEDCGKVIESWVLL